MNKKNPFIIISFGPSNPAGSALQEISHRRLGSYQQGNSQ